MGDFRHIELNVEALSLNPGFDLIQIHDGGSYDSAVIVNITGNTLFNAPIFSTGKQMMVSFTSTSANVTSNFVMKYSTYVCQHNCSGHGQCQGAFGRCSCDPGWKGDSCSVTEQALALTEYCQMATDKLTDALMVGVDQEHPSVVNHGVTQPGWEATSKVLLFTPPTVERSFTSASFFFWLDPVVSSLLPQPFITYLSPVVQTDPTFLRVAVSGSILNNLAIGSRPKNLTLEFSCSPDFPDTEQPSLPVKVVFPIHDGCDIAFQFKKHC